MRLIIPRLGKRKVDDDGFWEDVEELRKMTEKSIGPTNWPSGKPPAADEEIPEKSGAIVMARVNNPEPGPVNEIKPELAKEETRRERWRRLRAEVKQLEKVNDEKREADKND